MRIARGDRLRQRMVRKATHGRFLSEAVGMAGTNCAATRSKLRLSREDWKQQGLMITLRAAGIQLTVFRSTRSFRTVHAGYSTSQDTGSLVPSGNWMLDGRNGRCWSMVFRPRRCPGHSPRAQRQEMGTCRPEGYRGSGGLCGTLLGALKGASGPREGQKSTFCNRQSDSAN